MSNCKRCKSRRTIETKKWYDDELRWSKWYCFECEYEWTIYERRWIIGYDK